MEGKYTMIKKLLKNFKITEKTYKTHIKDRFEYTYQFADGTAITIRSGEDGITEEDIKRAHSLDDSEVYYNNKNLRPTLNAEEKEKIKRWEKNFIEYFKDLHGYEPTKDDIKNAKLDIFSKNYNLSLDYDFEGINSDKLEIQGFISTSDDYFSDKEANPIKEFLGGILTPIQLDVIWLYFAEGYKQNEIAEKIGITPSAVNKHYKKAKERIEISKKTEKYKNFLKEVNF